MKKIVRWILFVFFILVLMGCIETVTIIHVNKDGSGMIEEKVVITNAFTELIAGFSGEQAKSENEPEFLDEDELRERAAGMGQGVRLVSAEPIKSDMGNGYKAVFHFDDINKVKVNQNPGDSLPSMGEGGDAPPEELISFKFTKGATAKLEIINPVEPPQADSGEGGEADMNLAENPAMLDMMKNLYKDMKLAIIVEVDGKIVDTNASYRDGSRVTIMEMDFGKLMEDEDSFMALLKSNPDTIEEMKELSKSSPGIKVETEDRITIRFR